jgi:hypothetical protein
MSLFSYVQVLQLQKTILQIALMKFLEWADNRLEQVMLQEIPYEEPP